MRLEYSGRSEVSTPDRQYMCKCLASRIMQVFPVVEKVYACMEAYFDEGILATLIKISYRLVV